jgi:peptide deformylase
MAILRIVKTGDADEGIPYRPAARVRDFGPRLHQLLDDMLETVRAAPGVGIAGPQVGADLRVTVIECPEDPDKPEENLQRYELINPEVIKTKGCEEGQEGCLSLPGLMADVDRATYVLIRAQDRRGKEFRLKAYDWLARVIQHEIDHLQGVMMTDKAKQLYRLRQLEDGSYEAIPIENTLSMPKRLANLLRMT